MADKYDNGGYNSSDFKRNANQDSSANGPGEQQDGEGPKLNEKAGEYMRELLSEKIKLNNAKFPISLKLIDEEVIKVQASGRTPGKDNKYLDVYREKPTKVTVKVLVPLKEHPKFNFVGKLLGPKGNTMKQLQEETMCKMAVLGRGSMRDRQKEEELRNSLDPKYAHLSDELHVEIAAIAPPAEAHARIAYALAEVKKYLIPDAGPDMMWQPPMERVGHHAGPGGRPPPRGPPRMPAPHPPGRVMPAKTKVISILDRARSAMESSYSYDDPYSAPEPPMRVPPRAPDSEFYYDRAPERFYEDEPYYKVIRNCRPGHSWRFFQNYWGHRPHTTNPRWYRPSSHGVGAHAFAQDEAPRDYKGASAREVGTRRPQTGGPQRHQSYQRASPYGRPQNQRGAGGRSASKPSSSGGSWN